MSLKSRLKSAGIEPPTFRFVAQLHNHCVTTIPQIIRNACSEDCDSQGVYSGEVDETVILQLRGKM